MVKKKKPMFQFLLSVFWVYIDKNLILCYDVYRWEKSHIIKREHSVLSCLNVYPEICPRALIDRHSFQCWLECQFFITIIKKIIRNKMIEMSFKNFIIKVLVFIFINPPLYKRFGRHSTTDIPYINYII